MKHNWQNSGQLGQPVGYTMTKVGDVRWGWLWRKSTWDIRTDAEHPLTYISSSGLRYRMDRHFVSDFGSIPPPLRALPGLNETRFIGYLFHDSAYCHGGLWMSFDGGGEYSFQRLHRDVVDGLLREMVERDPTPGGMILAASIYYAVRSFGGLARYGGGDVRSMG